MDVDESGGEVPEVAMEDVPPPPPPAGPSARRARVQFLGWKRRTCPIIFPSVVWGVPLQ